MTGSIKKKCTIRKLVNKYLLTIIQGLNTLNENNGENMAEQWFVYIKKLIEMSVIFTNHWDVCGIN